MIDWMGLDSGGTEQLWEPDVLLDILKVMKVHEPFSRGHPESPIFDDLRSLHPHITWGEFRADGTFNPIFRRANPIVKLGLSTNETEGATITELGNDVLAGGISIAEVFAIAANVHVEQDGTHSFAQMCLAGLYLPEHHFSEADIEFGVSKGFSENSKILRNSIEGVRAKGLHVASTSRKRRLRSFMNVLVNAQAFAPTDAGWVLQGEEQAKKIANFGGEVPVQSVPVPQKSEGQKKSKAKAFASVEVDNRTRAPFDLSKSGKADPVKTAIALERSSQLHEDTVAALGMELYSMGIEPVEDPDSFDLAVFEGFASIFEVKTVNAKNAVSQIRKAIVQLEEYRWRHQHHFATSPTLFIVTSENPVTFLDEAYLDFIENDRGMEIIWPEKRFVDRHGRGLQEFLTLHS